jgi:glucose/arabinose dehydrogenase
MDRRTLFKAGIATTAGALVVPAAGGLTETAEARPRVVKVLARNMVTPWGIAFLPSGDALVGERDTGRIFRVRKNGGKRRVGRIRVHSQKASWGEGGLLGLALHPNFRRNRLVYAYISRRSDNRIIRFKYRRDGRLGKRRVVLKGIPTSTHHNGGRLLFHDGLLYVSTGDAERPHLAQRRGSLAGKILRMTPDGKVPRGNPFGNYTWSYGHRNIEGLAFDGKGRLWASEFGDDRWDELNRIVRGGNYGWPRSEGGDGIGRGTRDPLARWRPANCSPSGVAVAGGRAWLGGLRGHALWSVKLNGPGRGRKVRHFHERFGRIRTVQKAPDGSLWITTSNRDGRPSSRHGNDDRIIRVRI